MIGDSVSGTKRLGLYWRTLRHLRAVQIANRITRLIFSSKPRFFDSQKKSEFQPNVVWPRKKQSIFSNTKFSFLNKTEELTLPDDWQCEAYPLLWMYNLNYFDGLLSIETDNNLKAKCIRNWIEANSDNFGVAWDPYPTSLRVELDHGVGLIESMTTLLFLVSSQVNHLYHSLEYHLLGNHLLENVRP